MAQEISPMEHRWVQVMIQMIPVLGLMGLRNMPQMGIIAQELTMIMMDWSILSPEKKMK